MRRKNLIAVVLLLATLLGCASAVVAPRCCRRYQRAAIPEVYWGLRGDDYSVVKATRLSDCEDAYCALLRGRAPTKYNAFSANELFALITPIGPHRGGDFYHPSSDDLFVIIDDCGWPLRCFDTIKVQRNLVWSFLRGERAEGDILPGYIRWRPFTANAALFAAGWGALLWGVGSTGSYLRRRSRCRLGHCQACNYDRTGLITDAVCPECGKAP